MKTSYYAVLYHALTVIVLSPHVGQKANLVVNFHTIVATTNLVRATASLFDVMT